MKLNEISDRANIEQILNRLGIKNHTVKPDGSVDVDGGVNVSNRNLTQIPVKFGYVSGTFWCYNNNLTSLKGAPREVGGDFQCQRNNFNSEPDHSFIRIGGEFGWK
jgi:hypothetical protein